MLTLHVIFHGKVQGVGFRWTLVDRAEQFHLKGTAQNLKEGSVEVYAQGSNEDLERFLTSIKEDAGFANVTDVESEYIHSEVLFKDFHIVRGER